jgi:predicted RNA-binding protein with PUA-like domain
MAHWLLQGNPQRWRMDDFFREHRADELRTWSVTRYLDQVHKGDDLALWRSGRDAGVIALGHVTGPPYEAPGDTDEYWQDLEKADRSRWWLPIRLTEVFLDAPVTRVELRHDPRFAQAAILRMPAAGSPFPLSDQEWMAILDRNQGSGPAGAEPSPSGWSLEPGDRISVPNCISGTAASGAVALAHLERRPIFSSSPTLAPESDTGTTTSGNRTAVSTTPATASMAIRSSPGATCRSATTSGMTARCGSSRVPAGRSSTSESSSWTTSSR